MRLLFDRYDELKINIETAYQIWHDGNEVDNRAIFGVIFKLVHGNKNGDNNNYQFYNKGATGNKIKAKTTFDRMVYVADLQSPGSAFIMIFHHDEASCILNALKEDSVIGRPIIVLELFCTKGNTLQDIPVLETVHAVIPLKWMSCFKSQ